MLSSHLPLTNIGRHLATTHHVIVILKRQVNPHRTHSQNTLLAVISCGFPVQAALRLSPGHQWSVGFKSSPR